MASTIFFTWQADTPTNVGRNFIRAALETICKELSAGAELAEAARDLHVDSDIQGVAGQPPIAETILKKINDAAVIVADVTFTGKRLDDRPTPNPNVLIEYGWALKAHGYHRVISVMNAAYGEPSWATLPFDLAHLRWPLTYTLAADASDETRAERKRELTRELKKAVMASLATLPETIAPAPTSFVAAAAGDGPARFRSPDEAVGIDDDPVSGGNRDVFIAEGPAIWLRVMPATAQEKRWSAAELRRIGEETFALNPLRAGPGNYSYVRASDGHGMYRMSTSNNKQDRIVTKTIAFAFRTGEIWSIDTSLLAYDEASIMYDEIAQTFTSALDRYRRFLQRLGVAGPYQWLAGLVGVKGRLLRVKPRSAYDWLENPVCTTDHIEATGHVDEEQASEEALAAFFTAIFDECGVDPSNFLGAK